MDGIIAFFDQLTVDVLEWMRLTLLTRAALVQAVVVAGVAALGGLLAVPLRGYIVQNYPGDLQARGHLPRVARTLISVLPALFVVVLLLAARALLERFGHPALGVKAAGDVLLAFVLVRLVASVVLSRFWARAAAVVAVLAVGLEVAGVLGPVLAWVDGFGLELGDTRVTLVTLVKGLVVLLVLMRLGNWGAEVAERRMRDVPDMTPSMRVLLAKIVRIGLFVVAVLVTLSSVGIDLTALTVFSGAVGVGLGFGLQKVFSNLASGFILLMDKSIKPGDVIEIGGVYGWIKELRARFVSVVTRDGTEYLIPNEDLITGQVVNWSFSDTNVRIKLPVGVSYGTEDLRGVIDIVGEAAQGIGRVLDEPAPRALFRGFGDSSLDLELRFWIRDPQNGVANVTSEVALAVWEALRDNDVEVPFPQRDVHIVSTPQGAPVPVPTQENGQDADDADAGDGSDAGNGGTGGQG